MTTLLADLKELAPALLLSTLIGVGIVLFFFVCITFPIFGALLGFALFCVCTTVALVALFWG